MAVDDLIGINSIVKAAATYMVRAGDAAARFHSEAEVAATIIKKNAVLDEAIRIGDASRAKVNEPTLRGLKACTVAYLLLEGRWPAEVALEQLTKLQRGFATADDGDKAPYFIASEVVRKARNARENKDRLNQVRELGVVILALKQSVVGNSTSASVLKAEVKKQPPVPVYPPVEEQLAAAD